MNLGIASYITSAGLKAVTSAGVLGPYFAIKYFLPIYDYRIDKTICRELSGSTSATSISALNLVSATNSNLFGEKIYANGVYDVSKNSFLYWNSVMGSLPDGINRNVISQQSVSTDVNLFSGKPLSIVVSGSKFMSSATGRFDVSGTHIVSGAELASYNPLSGSTWPTSAFYRVAGYSPNVNGLTSATGTYKCRIPPSNSSFKFNGLALYAVKVDGNGFDDYGNGTTFGFNPTLFSVVLFDQAQYKENDVGGVNDFEISVDLGFDWNIISSSTSAVPRYIETNYWVKVPTATSTSAYALNYDGDIVISSSAVAGSYAPKAKLTVTDPYKKQLRLANDNDRFTDFRTIRFAEDIIGPVPNSTDRAVLSIDTSCPTDSLLQLGYNVSATGVKSIAIGCNSSAMGYSASISSNNVAGGYTVAIGVNNLSRGFGSIALGQFSSAIGYLNFVGGDYSVASYDQTNYDPNEYEKSGLNFAYGKNVSAISRGPGYSAFEYWNMDSILADQETYGSNIAFGVRSIASGGLSFVNGAYASATGVNSFGLGYRTLAKGHFSFVGGINSSALSDMNIAFGDRVISKSPFGFAYGKNVVIGGGDSSFNIGIGYNVSASGHRAIALGRYSIADGLNAFAYGQNYDVETKPTVANGEGSIAIGLETSALAKYSIAIGQQNVSDGYIGAISIGQGNYSSGAYSVAIGQGNFAIGNYSLAANFSTSASGFGSISFGYGTKSSGNYSMSIGSFTVAAGLGSFAGGFASSANGANSLAYGTNAKTDGDDSVALGYESQALYSGSVAIGKGATTDADNQIVIGSCEDTVVIRGTNIRIGDGCSSVVTIPGISQFNDSIKYSVEFVGITQNGAEIDYHNSRRLTISVTNGGVSNTIVMSETEANSCRFIVDSVSPSFKFGNVVSTQVKLHNLFVGSDIYFKRNNIQVDGSSKDFNILVSFNRSTRDIIIVGYDYDNIPTTYTLYQGNTTNLYNDRIFISNCDNENNGTSDTNVCVWQPNVNIIDSKINYRKYMTNVALRLDVNKSSGDGICAYNLYCRTLYGIAFLKLLTPDNSNVPTEMFTAFESGSGGNGYVMSGMFVNSGNMCIANNSYSSPIA